MGVHCCRCPQFLLVAVLTLAGCQRPIAEQPQDESLEVTPTVAGTELLERMAAEIAYCRDRRILNTKDHAAWQVLHGIVAYGRDLPLRAGDQQVKAVDYLLEGGQLTGWQMAPGDVNPETGRRGLRAILEAGSKTGQGHYDQWLGYMAQCGLDPQQKIFAAGQEFTLADYLWQVEWDVPRNSDREYSWTLMALTSYHPTSYEWTASDGRQWSIAGLVESEAQQDLGSAACGGTHRLVGLTMAVNRHLADGGELEGPWALADDVIQKAVRTARDYQNPNGSFSSNYFARPGMSVDLADELRTTGHTLEFLTFALTDDQLREPWVTRAADRLTELFQLTRPVPIECGALYHAAHALVLYHERMK